MAIYKIINRYYNRPVIPCLTAMIFGIVVGYVYPVIEKAAFAAVLISASVILFNIIKKRDACILPLILFFGIGYLSILPFVCPRLPPDHIVHYTDSQKWNITGIVEDAPEIKGDRTIFYLRVESLGQNNSSHKSSGNIRVTMWGTNQNLHAGDRIAFISKIRSIRNFSNPGGFNYKQQMIFKGVWGSAYANKKNIIICDTYSNRTTAAGVIQQMRESIAGRIDSLGYGDHLCILKALIIGDCSQISQELRDDFNRAGAGHLLAISGLHIGIVATVSYFIFYRVLSLFNVLLWNAWVKKGAVMVSLVPVLIYGFLSGMSPSTQRAVIMVAVFLVAFLFEKETDLFNTIAIAGMLILIFYPPALFSISFQLSFSAVIAIVCCMPKLLKNKTDRQKKVTKKAVIWLYSLVLVSFCATIGTLPLVMYYFNQVSLIGLLTNIVFVPLIGFIAVPAALFSVFIYPVSSFLSLLCLKSSAAVLSKSLILLHFFSDLPFAAAKTITPGIIEITCYYAAFWSIVNIRHASRVTQRVAVTALACSIIIFTADTCYWLYQRFWDDDFKITILDVGQGSAALLEMPAGPCYLIDGGGFSSNSMFDVGERIIAPFLWKKKIASVDGVILSHPNSDHLNGLLYIAEHFHVKSIWTNNQQTDTQGYQRLMDIIKRKHIDMPVFKDMRKSVNINGVVMKILYPPDDFIERINEEKWRARNNNNSLVIKVEFGSTSFLFPGDIMKISETELVTAVGDTLKSMVLMAPHHGSRSSNSDIFLEAVSPQVVIISSGWDNRFGFPHEDVLETYTKMNAKVYNTSSDGAIRIISDGRELAIQPVTDHQTCM